MIGLASASAILLLVSLVGICSNLVALLTVKRTKYMHNTFGALCVSLASCNLGVCLIYFGWCSVATLSMVDSVDRVFFDSELGKKVGQIALLFLYGSIYTHLAVSFNRMMSLMYPLRYLLMFDMRKSAALLCVVWTLAFIEIVPYFWSRNCYFFYKYEVALWEFAETECGEFFGFYFDFLPSIVVVFFILAMDVVALIKLRASHKDAFVSTMSQEQRKARKIEIGFFIQSLCQTVPFLMAVLCFHVVSRYAETDWQLFWAMTFSWVSLHTIDGFIIDIFHTRRSVFKLKMKIVPSFSVSNESHGDQTKSAETRQ
ncbi:hypothetical protein PRIPAC_91421 [Pristionchus pacificus]|uniref:G protein-coupled receptor n=1 Tax=Pristionchus pacificus TaxID=54126 RepID=A0A2A6CWA6_PRIPA|nr:hypothetical protein PRIPAC_91421 [Pristionchus pacificus]|eukprot:PDM82366.1 G protein-coupled receptor [Pristionchus pacificus]